MATLRTLPLPGRSYWARASRSCIHTSAAKEATPVYPTRPGPPPAPPKPSVDFPSDRVERAKQQAKLLKLGQQLKANPAKPAANLRKRFWNEVYIVEQDGGLQIHLDKRPVRAPSTKVPITLPHARRHLATAIALEWDTLVSAQQALKNHRIPLTSLTARAVDIEEADKEGNTEVRDSIIRMLMRYLTTDTLLCWAPEKNIHDAYDRPLEPSEQKHRNLRELQEETATPIIAHLTTYIWPGVELQPTLDPDSIMPQEQSEMSMQIIRGWLTGLSAFDLAAMERGVLASKSVLVATRFLVDWSDSFADVRKGWESTIPRFGVEEAAEASSLEVNWQTRMWGEVEDTHDVDKEDVRRQLGSALLLVHGS